MNIESIKRRLLIKYPLFGSIVANSNFIAEPTEVTAGTDGKNIYYNPKFIESITDDQQTFIFAHEICHIAFDHISRREGKDKDLWNIAADSVVNAFLKQDGLPIVEGGVDIPEAINYDVEEMYKKLVEKPQYHQNQKGSNSQNNGSGNRNENQNALNRGQQSNSEHPDSRNNNDTSKNSEQGKIEGKRDEHHDVEHDTHSRWNKAREMKKSDEIKRLIELGEKEAFNQNKIARKKTLEELRKALVSQSHGYGNDTNSERRNITDVGTSKPLIDWRKLLKEAVQYDIDWSYQNAGIEDGLVTAYLEEIPRLETEILLDTSGSIDEILLRNFLRECKNILKTSKVKVGCFDTKFYGFTEIKDASDIDNLTFYGGGGTNFDVAVSAFTRRVENKIIFTDGAAAMPMTSIDAIWIIFGGTKINPMGGKVIHIDDEQLKELYNYQITNESRGRSR